MPRSVAIAGWFAVALLAPVATRGWIFHQRVLSAQDLAGAQVNGNAEADDANADLFEKLIRPALEEHCVDCHAIDSEASGGLLLDSRDGWLAGGDSGAAIEPGDAKSSRLFQAISYKDTHLQMPPDGKLPKSVINAFRRWIDSGAYDPRSGSASVERQSGLPVERAQEHWAYRPIQVALDSDGVAEQPAAGVIDALIDARLREEQIEPAGPVSKAVLLRRLAFDLTGLPPTETLRAAYLDSGSQMSYEEVVDQLLGAPEFGEHFARKWMDVARYAESITLRGFVLPSAWRYRDYLITAFASDRPFDQMIREQVAGDMLDSEDVQERQMQLIATGFLALGNTNLEQQDKAQLEMDYIDEQLEVVGRAFLGQTIGCARCHDHKFDPIPTSDYYALAGIFRSTIPMKHDNVSKWIEHPLPLPPDEEAELRQLGAKLVSIDAELVAAKADLKKWKVDAPPPIAVSSLPGIVVDNRNASLVGKWTSSERIVPYVGEDYVFANPGEQVHSATFEPEGLEPGAYEVRLAYTPHANRASNATVKVFSADGEKEVVVDQRQEPPDDAVWTSLGKFSFERNGQAYVLVNTADANGAVVVDAVQFLPVANDAPSPAQIVDALPESEGVERTEDVLRIEQRIATLEKKKSKIAGRLSRRPKYLTIVEGRYPQDLPIHIRGDVHNLGEVVPRGFLTAIAPPQPTFDTGESGRLHFARWLTDDQNPLAARVYANRIWLWLMGRGLVATPNNFGVTGQEPSHLELLDWLARELQTNNWSTKHMVKLIVMSDAYRREIALDNDMVERDPDNRFYARGHSRRLPVEALRDAMLVVSGELTNASRDEWFGKGVNADYGFASENTARSIYQPVFRNALPPLFEAFDFADTSVSIGQRPRSTVATQALALLNHPWVTARAEATAKQLDTEFALANQWEGDSLRAVLDVLYQRALSRQPTERERELALEFLLNAPTKEERVERLEQLVHSVFASLDFRYLD